MELNEIKTKLNIIIETITEQKVEVQNYMNVNMMGKYYNIDAIKMAYLISMVEKEFSITICDDMFDNNNIYSFNGLAELIYQEIGQSING